MGNHYKHHNKHMFLFYIILCLENKIIYSNFIYNCEIVLFKWQLQTDADQCLLDEALRLLLDVTKDRNWKAMKSYIKIPIITKKSVNIKLRQKGINIYVCTYVHTNYILNKIFLGKLFAFHILSNKEIMCTQTHFYL